MDSSQNAGREVQVRGFTLLDCVLSLALIAILSAVSFPRASHFLDSLSVHAASSDAFALFSAARSSAVNKARQATIEIDTARSTITVRAAGDTILERDLGLAHQVRLSATRTTAVISPNGLGYGAGNLTLVIRRGTAVDSLFVSRLGRVRH